MSSSAVVVVIVGAVICSIAYLLVRGTRPTETGSKPATAWRPRAFAGESTPTDPPGRWAPTQLEHDEPVELPPLPPPRRARAVALLSVGVVLLGAAAAAVIGAVTFLAAHAINKALG